MIFSRQGTTDAIEEVEDEQDQGEENLQLESEKLEEEQQAEEMQSDEGQPKEKEDEEEEEEEELREGDEEAGGEEVREDQEPVGASCESMSPDEGPSAREDDAESAPSAQENDSVSESEHGGRGQQDVMQTEGQAVVSCTPDTDAEVPPSYSKAVSFDRLEVSDDESDSYRRRRMVMTSDSRSDSRSDIMLPSMTTELTASELLLNK